MEDARGYDSQLCRVNGLVVEGSNYGEWVLAYFVNVSGTTLVLAAHAGRNVNIDFVCIM